MRCLACAAAAPGVRATVKSGGHSFAGYSTIAAPGFVISTALMKQVRVERKTFNGSRSICESSAKLRKFVFPMFQQKIR
jgi:hypothetical protein